MGRTLFLSFNIVFLLLLIVGCDENGQGEKKTFDENGWKLADSLVVSYNVEDTQRPKGLKLGLVLDEKYPYRNIYLRFNVRAPDGKTQTSLSEFVLAEADGVWHVESDWSGRYVFAQYLNPKALLAQKGKYIFSLAQYMRNDSLPGVKEVSFSIEEAKDK